MIKEKLDLVRFIKQQEFIQVALTTIMTED